MLRRKLFAMGKNFLAHVIIEVSADMIQKLGITSSMAEEMFLDQAVELDNEQAEQETEVEADTEEQQEEDSTEDEIPGPDFDDEDSFVVTQIYDVLQVNQGNRTIFALCVKVIDRKTGEPWWLPYRFLKKAAIANGESD